MKFKYWNQLTCVILAHIRYDDSLRDSDIALNANAARLYHIGIKQYPKPALTDATERIDSASRCLTCFELDRCSDKEIDLETLSV
jgi:hypothetical protein